MSRLNAQYGTLYRTQGFQGGHKAEAEGGTPIYEGR
jgi:hypothetical protein